MRKTTLFTVLLAIVSAGTMYGATAAKGVFTVNAQGKTVQFANAASKVGETELFKWRKLPELIEQGWEVLKGEEWSYLLADGRTDAATKNALGTVAGKKGLIILPDDWTLPAGLEWKGNDFDYDHNKYTAEQWTLMADAGAVFLPCGGYGYDDGSGHHEVDQTDWGAYWAADEHEGPPAGNAYSIHFGEGTTHDQNYYSDTTRYYSVILVREAPSPVESIILDEIDELDAYTDKWNAAKANSFAYVRRTLKKDGTFYTLCLPFDVPNIEASPLAGAEVFTFDGGTVSGTEGNEVLNLSLTSYTGERLSAGVPYVLRWANTGEILETPIYFANVENWDDDTNAGTDPGNDKIKFHGVYPRARIPGYETGTQPHYNFYMGANNTLYWPDDTLYPNSKMKGFRAYFYIIPGGGPNAAAVKRGMQAVWKINNGLNSPTGVQNTEYRVQTEKLLQDGRIVIIIDGEHYTIGGQKL